MADFHWPIIGHQKITNYLQSVIKKGTLGHAYLFYGSAGLGKNLLADFFIKSILCQAGQNRPCNGCSSCREIDRHIHPDVIYLEKPEDKKNISVEEVRAARSKIQNFSLLNSYKIMIIRDAETLSLGAVNALLKILEEPVGQTIFVFIAEDIKFLPQTLLSRLQIIKFLPVNHEEIEAFLTAQGLARHESYELAHLSLGFPGRILPFAGHPKNFNEYQAGLVMIIRRLSGSLNERLLLVAELSGQNNSEVAKEQVRDFLKTIIAILRDALLWRSDAGHLIAHRFLETELQSFATSRSLTEIRRLIITAKNTLRLLNQNVNLRLALENLVLEF